MFPTAPLPANEPLRLARLRALDVLDTAAEPLFDAFAQAAAVACETPVALISLVDADRQWFKARVGMQLRETERCVSLCAHALLCDDLLHIEATCDDARFADNPLVAGPDGVKFYAGVPLILSGGVAVGTLCVIDHVPRRLSEAQRRQLRSLAGCVVEALEARAKNNVALGELAAAQDHLAALYRSTPAALFTMEPTTGIVLVVSDTLLNEVGYARDEIIGRRVFEFLTPTSQAFALERGVPMLLRDGRTIDHEYQFIHRDGSVMDVLISAVLERDPDGTPARSISVFENITPRRAAEAALREEQARMERILEGTHAGTWELNVQTGETRYNARWAEIAGYALEEFGETTSATWRRLIHPDDLDRATEEYLAHCAGEIPYYELEFRIRHKTGALIWVLDRGRVSARDASGKPLWMHGTRTDISERKKTEENLVASQRFLESVGEVAGVGGWALDFRTGCISWSEQTRRMFEADDDFSPSLENALSFFSAEARPTLQAAVEESQRSGRGFDLQLPFRSQTGRALWTRAVGSVVFDGDRPARLIGALQDVTRQKEMEEQLAQGRELLQVTLDSIGDAVITTDVDGTVQWLNPVAERMTGWSKAECVGHPLGDFFVIVDNRTRAALLDPVARCLADAEVVGASHNATLVARGGEEYGIEESVSPIRDGEGRVHGAVLVFRDVSEQRLLHQEMNHRATHDPLTGLGNRSGFEARLLHILQSVGPSVDHVLLYIDLDQFKLVNDACGHAAGDQLLRQVSAILTASVRIHDTVARLGGDEFGILLEHCDTASAQRVAQAICDRMDEFRFVHDAKRFRVGTSIGLVPVDHRWTGIKALLQAADASCYAAKDGGRNRVHAWLDSDQVIKLRHGDMQWVNRIEFALDENRFELFGQRIEPIGAARGGEPAGLHFEVLLRLRDADDGLVLPGAFLPTAERFHLATRIDRWVVRKAFDWMRIAHNEGIDVESMSINLSGQSLGDRAFHRDIAQMMRSAPFDVRKLCFEVTETAAITHLADARAFIDEVRALGVKVSLDDFGAGASSFGYLKSLPVDYLKIDGHFIRHLLEDELNNAAVRCFCDVAKVVGVQTIAECVEREDVRAALAEIGVDHAQGFLLHRPEPLETLLTCLTT